MTTPTFIILGLGTPFPNSFEKMALDFIYSHWSLTGNLQKGDNPLGGGATPKKMRFKVGFPDYHKPYELDIIKMRTEAKPMDSGHYQYECYTHMDVALRMKRKPRDTYVNPELTQMEEELSRIIVGYEKDPAEIQGVMDLVWLGDERVYGGNDSWANSNWRSIGHFAFWYQKGRVDIP